MYIQVKSRSIALGFLIGLRCIGWTISISKFNLRYSEILMFFSVYQVHVVLQWEILQYALPIIRPSQIVDSYYCNKMYVGQKWYTL